MGNGLSHTLSASYCCTLMIAIRNPLNSCCFSLSRANAPRRCGRCKIDPQVKTSLPSLEATRTECLGTRASGEVHRHMQTSEGAKSDTSGKRPKCQDYNRGIRFPISWERIVARVVSSSRRRPSHSKLRKDSKGNGLDSSQIRNKPYHIC